MNSWPGPENSWEGVDAYFTSANSEGTLIFWTLLCIALLAVSYTHLTLPTKA